MKYYIGLDNGGTLTKAALYDLTGNEIAVASVATKMLTPKTGFCERDMDEMWDANCFVLRELLCKSGVDPQEVRCIACCGHGKGLYLWGKDGRPVRNGIISTDNRAWEYPLRWERDGTAREVFERSCQKILACQPVSLLAWLRDHEPACIDEIRWVFECKDYVRFRLTGEAFGEITDYSGTNLVNLHTGRYDMELLRLFGLEMLADSLPPLRLSTEVCGRITREAAALTGLVEGTPVAGGMFDIDACALAVDAVDENRVCMIAGTWSINEYVAESPVLDGRVMMNSFFCLPEHYLIEECSPTSAGNNEWFVNTLLPELKRQADRDGKSVYDLVNDLVASVGAEDPCPVFLPFLMASNVHPEAQAAFVGISNRHTRAHIVRSVYEGIAFSHRHHFDKLLATRREPVATIRLAGGVACSDVWSQMFADVMNHPVETVSVNETGALGCAVAAAVAVGDYPEITAAAREMVRVKRRFEPIARHAVAYERKYAAYRRVIEALDSAWSELHDLNKVCDNG